MPLETQEGYVFLEQDPHTHSIRLSDELRRQLMPQWLIDEITRNSGAEDALAFEQQYLSAITGELSRLAQDPENWLDRGVPVARSRFKIGNTSIPLKQVLWSSVVATGPIFVAVSALVTGPATLVLAAHAAAAIGPAIANVARMIRTYSPTELDVHNAVAAALGRIGPKILHGDGATLAEIEKSFSQDSSLIKPRNLQAVLDDMAGDKKRMLVKSLDGGVEVYKPNQF
jgi:hypothetical protein